MVVRLVISEYLAIEISSFLLPMCILAPSKGYRSFHIGSYAFTLFSSAFSIGTYAKLTLSPIG
jgi:hypothetical protein